MNACMRYLWVRQGLSYGMLLCSLGSCLRKMILWYTLALVYEKVRKFNSLSEPQITLSRTVLLRSVIVQIKTGVLFHYDHTVHLI